MSDKDELDQFLKNIENFELLDSPASPSKAAKAEEQAFERGSYAQELDEERDKNAHGRREELLNEVSRWAKWLVRAVAVCLLLMILVWFYHLIIPFPFLSLQQLDKIEGLVLSGSLSAVVVGSVKMLTR